MATKYYFFYIGIYMLNKTLNRSLLVACLLAIYLFNLYAYGMTEVTNEIQKTTLSAYFDGSVCGATRVSEDLVLTAAHCAFDYDGKSKPKTVQLRINDKFYDAKIVERGNFDPINKKMSDWVLLSPNDFSCLEKVSIAKFPTKKEIEDLKGNMGEFIGKKGTKVLMATSSVISYRIFPRKSLTPDGFISYGYLKSDTEYKKSLLFTLKTSQVYDEDYGPKPKFEIDVTNEWDQIQKLEKEKLKMAKGMNRDAIQKSLSVFESYNDYKNDDNPIWFHTADYSNGSSGSGVFSENQGSYLGLIPMGVDPVDQRFSYRGRGRLYRIDHICGQSKILLKLNKCASIAVKPIIASNKSN